MLRMNAAGKAAKVTLLSTVLAAALGLVLGLTAVPGSSYACHRNTTEHGNQTGCSGGGGGGGGGGGPAKVIFDDVLGDTIVSDGDPYIDGPAVSAGVPPEGSPPGQFLMVLRLGEGRSLLLDFGAAVDCDGADFEPLGCVDDKFENTVECPFPVGERVPNDTACSGSKEVVMAFRHALVGESNDKIYMLGMENDASYEGEADNYELQFRIDKQRWRLRFQPGCLSLDAGKSAEYLEITATDNDNDDVLPNDEWHIGTGGGTKTACLTKTARGRNEDLIGLFDMKFGYKVCILADPDSDDDACIGE